MKKIISSAMVCALLCGAAFSANAAGFGDALKDKMGSGSSSGSSSALSALGLSSSGTASNAAGVITYCMKNNYLNADKAAQVKDQLLGKIGLGLRVAPKDEGYLGGLSGVITGSDGKSFSLDKVKGSLKEKACDLVLDNAKSLL